MSNSTSAREEFIFTKEQVIPLALIPIPSAILSFVGSILIISSIRRNQRGRNNNQIRNNSNHSTKLGSYERLLLSMSYFDLLSTSVYVWSPFLAPTDYWWPTPNHFGNANTCRFIGAMVQFSLSNLIYFGWLGMYFLLTIRFHMRQETFARRVEPWMHVSAITFSLVTALVGGILDFYDQLELFPGCWIDNYPKGCSEGECLSPLIAWICAGIPCALIIVSLLASNLTISCYVAKRYGRHSSVTVAASATNNSSGRRNSFDRNRILFRSESLSGGVFNSSLSHQQDPQRSSHVSQQRYLSFSFRGQLSSSNPSTITPEAMGRTIQSRLSGSLHPIGQVNRVRLVSSQASLYVGSFFLTHTWFFVLQIVESMDWADRAHFPVYPFMILQAMFGPLAGFWNALIFFRPKYISLRRYHLRRQQRQLERRRQQQLEEATSSSVCSTGESDVPIVARWEIICFVLFGNSKRSSTCRSDVLSANAEETNYRGCLEYVSKVFHALSQPFTCLIRSTPSSDGIRSRSSKQSTMDRHGKESGASSGCNDEECTSSTTKPDQSTALCGASVLPENNKSIADDDSDDQ